MRLSPGPTEFAFEAVGLGAFMAAACVVATAVEHPASPLRNLVDDAVLRRALMGAAMGLVAVALLSCPWGRRSGAQLNPAVTFASWVLGRIGARDATGYVAAQFAGGMGGVALSGILLGDMLSHPSVQFVATLPGAPGKAAAAAGEFAISFAMMGTALALGSAPRLAPWACGIVLAASILLEAPLSGASLNPARTFASAIAAGRWDGAWIYFVAPPAGMLAAVSLRQMVLSATRRDPDRDGMAVPLRQGTIR